MTTVFKAPPPETSETERQNARRMIRRQIAERDSLAQRARVHSARLADLDAEADAAVERHRQTCEPIQEQLAQIEESILSAATDRQPIDPGLETQRRELLDQLHDANNELSDATDRLKRLRKPVVAELKKLTLAVGKGAALENQLFDTGDPAKLREHFAQTFLANAMGNVRHAAEEKLAECQKGVMRAKSRRDDAAVALWEDRANKWPLVLSKAMHLAEQMTAKAETLRSEIIDE